MASVLLNEPYAFSAATLEPCHLRIMQRNAFLAMLDAEPIFWKQVCLVGAKCHVDTLSEIKKDSLVRLVQLLLSFCGAFQEQETKGGTYRVRTTETEIGDSVGLSDRMVRQHLASLREKGLIVREGGWLLVIHPQGLRNLLERIK